MLPINKQQAHKAATWMKANFRNEMEAAVHRTAFNINHICGIACQETAYLWLSWIDTMKVEDVLALCIGDASGDYPGTQRSAFPQNTQIVRDKYGDGLTKMLIDQANMSRAVRGFRVYRGYGIYQYDLQHVLTDKDFFAQKKWHSYPERLARVMRELKQKYTVYGDIWKTIKAYNGSGDRATIYANNVIQFTQYCSEV
jgi:hypothetical protein